MTDWSAYFHLPEGTVPSDSVRVVHAARPDDYVQDEEHVRLDGDAWLIETRESGFFQRLFHKGRSVQLFDVEDPGCTRCLLVYRATMKTEALQGHAYLEMWCRMAGGGKFFSRGLTKQAEGTMDWVEYETPFFLREGDCPELVELNVVVEGAGKVWVRDVELLAVDLGDEAYGAIEKVCYGRADERPESGATPHEPGLLG